MPVEDFRHRGRLSAGRIPQMHGEDQRILARIIVKHRFRRRVRQDAAIPIEFTIDTNGGKSRRQGAGRHNVLCSEFAIAAVEIFHLAGAHMRSADRQPRRTFVDQIKIDQFIAMGVAAVISSIGK